MTDLALPPQLELQAATRYAVASRAAATRRAYASQWSAFELWCTNRGVAALPALPATVAAYIAFRADAGARPSSIDVALAAIAKAHQLAGHSSPRESAEVREVRAGIRRTRGTAPAQKRPVSVDALRAMVRATRPGVIGVRDRALLLLGFAGAFRRSELVQLDVDDVVQTDQGLQVTLRRSKTDQEGAGRKVGIPYGAVPETCPVRALQLWLQHVHAGALFRTVIRTGRVMESRISAGDVARLVKRYAAAVGFDPKEFAGHSLRAGLVTAAARVKSNRSIRKQTGHKTDAMVDRYVRDVELFDDNAAEGIGL